MELDTTRIPFGDGALAIHSVGRGAPILFVHGWPLHAMTWRDVVEPLRDRWRCHLLDLPGSGDSDHGPDTDFSPRGLAAAVTRAIDGLGLDRVTLVGFDSGGTYARLAAAGDRRVTGLVLGNTEIPGHRPPLIGTFQKLARLPGSTATFRLLMRSRRYRRSRMGFGGCFVDLGLLDGPFHDEFVRPLIDSRHRLEGQLGVLHGFDWAAVDGLTETHAAIDAPVKLVWGARDRFFPLDHARAMATTFARPAELVVIDDAKLYVHAEHPARFAAEIERFLADQGPIAMAV